MRSSPSSTVESVSLKSKRLLTSRLAWSTALRTSCRSTLETTSNVGMTRRYRDPRTTGRCPSGQREQTVNLPAQPTMVRIHPGPRMDPYAVLGLSPSATVTEAEAAFRHLAEQFERERHHALRPSRRNEAWRRRRAAEDAINEIRDRSREAARRAT